MKTPNPIPYAPAPWQLPRLAAAKPGEEVLLVEVVEPQPEMESEWLWLPLPRGGKLGQHKDDHESIARLCNVYCPLGPVGSIIRIEGAGDFRTTDIDLRRTDSMTESESLAWGVSRQWSESHRVAVAKNCWNLDHPSHPWGAWAWFVKIERIER